MEITKTVTIEIDIDEIVEEYGLNKKASLKDIYNAVRDYTEGLDDAYYYLINEQDEENICHAVLNALEYQEEDEE